MEEDNTNPIKEAFGKKRIVALAGIKNSGKTNNLVYMIKQYRKHDTKTPIFAYGLEYGVMQYLKKKLGVKEISQLSHLVNKKGCILILDEFQRLKLNDRRYKDDLNEFIDFVYHNNVYVLLSSPNIREFNSVIGGVIERWLLKEVRIDQCVNGSQLKKAIDSYQGRYKTLGSIAIDKDKILVIDDEEDIIIRCPYVPEADNKKSLKSIF